MKYLVTEKGKDPYLTKWFDYTNYNRGMIVFNLETLTYTTNGRDWEYIETDVI